MPCEQDVVDDLIAMLGSQFVLSLDNPQQPAPVRATLALQPDVGRGSSVKCALSVVEDSMPLRKSRSRFAPGLAKKARHLGARCVGRKGHPNP
jgi:hypothetical protein